MSTKNIIVGADRFIALKWANYAFELFQTQGDEEFLYQTLRSYLNSEIEGKETSRKVSNHLKRLWLTKDDPYQKLRLFALSNSLNDYLEALPIFHLGLAINIFPIYLVTLRALGTLENLINPIPKQIVTDRVLEYFGNTSSIPRTVARVLQTLEDWGFIIPQEKFISLKHIEIKDHQISAWLIAALIMSNNNELLITEIPSLPEKLGLEICGVREVIRQSKELTINRNVHGLEIIESLF